MHLLLNLEQKASLPVIAKAVSSPEALGYSLGIRCKYDGDNLRGIFLIPAHHELFLIFIARYLAECVHLCGNYTQFTLTVRY